MKHKRMQENKEQIKARRGGSTADCTAKAAWEEVSVASGQEG